MRFIEFKQGQKFAVSGAEQASTMAYFEDAGYLLDNNDLILDLDFNTDKESAHKIIYAIMTAFDVKTHTVLTDRGAHFYFNKTRGFKAGEGICYLGIKAEYKTKSNTPNGITVKRNGVAREVLNEGIRQDIPEVFNRSNGGESVFGLSDGDGRNNRMLPLLGRVKGTLGIDMLAKVAHFVNDYIFADPLPLSELETLIEQATEFQGIVSGIQELNVAKRIVEEFRVVSYNNSVWYFDGKRYVMDSGDKMSNLRRLCYQESGERPTKFSDEVYKHVVMSAKLIPDTRTFHVRFKNGVLDYDKYFERTGSSVIPIDDYSFSPYYIDIDYHKDAEPVKIVDDYLNNLTQGDDNYRQLLLESLASTLITDDERKRALAKIFIFIGKGGEGKGTMLTVLRKILGTESVSGVSPEEMTKEQYVFSMVGKLANLSDDVENKAFDDKKLKVLKNISTCDTVEMRKLFSQSFTAQLTCTLIMTSNHLLKSFEKGNSWKRRVVWLPMFIRVEKKDPKFISKLTTPQALEYWLRLLVEAYERLCTKGELTSSNIVDTYNEDYHLENNNTLSFLESYNRHEIIGMKPSDLYNDYKSWFISEYGEDEKPFKQRTVVESTQEFFNVVVKNKRVNGIQTRSFQEVEEVK